MSMPLNIRPCEVDDYNLTDEQRWAVAYIQREHAGAIIDLLGWCNPKRGQSRRRMVLIIDDCAYVIEHDGHGIEEFTSIEDFQFRMVT